MSAMNGLPLLSRTITIHNAKTVQLAHDGVITKVRLHG